MPFAGTGVVISWNDRGYGFVRDDSDHEKDLFAHAKDVQDNRARKPSARVCYDVVSSSRGFQAVKVRLAAAQEPEGECDVLTEEEFLAELKQIDWPSISLVQGLVAMARKHGWVDG